MQDTLTIQHVLHKDINKQKWDECIQQATNSLIYGYAFYLDEIAPGWNALIAENYSWVLPLTNKRKFGISYLYQPPFTQQLGVFTRENVMVPWQEIIGTLKREYKFWEMQWNYFTPSDLPAEIVKPATNFIIDLSQGHENISGNYSKDLQRNLKRSNRFNYRYETNDNFKNSIQLYKKYYGNRMPHVTETDYKAFENICSIAMKENRVLCRQVINEKNEVLAIALLLFDGRRLYNMMNTTTAAGRKTEANHFLLNAIIHEFSGRNIVFDFEGSDLPGVKAFYENFAPVNQPYYFIRHNALPWPLNWLKQ